MAIEINKENYNELVASDKLLLIDFGAEWCGPCKALAPIVEELSEEFADRANIGKCDVEENDDLAVKYSIRNVPTIIFVKGYEVVDRHVGAISKMDLKTKIEAHL